MSYPTPSPPKGSLPGQRGYPTLRPAQSRRSGDIFPWLITAEGHNSEAGHIKV